MAPAGHLGLADQGVDRARAGRQVVQMGLRPRMDIVILRIAEGAACVGDDTHDHPRLVQILYKQRHLLLRVAPPAHNLRRIEPSAQKRKVGARHRAKRIGR
jgi:hypothetical protein